jgi:threonine dehydrogenase-like Zn-dependent dehydrogenase
MRGVILHAPGDIRVEPRADPKIEQPTDVIIRLAATCVCGSSARSWPPTAPARSAGPGTRAAAPTSNTSAPAGRKPSTSASRWPTAPRSPCCRPSARPAPVRRFLPDLIGRIESGVIDPGKVFDLTLPLGRAAEGYRAMDERRAIKTLLHP